MTTKHTPGPWTVQHPKDRPHPVVAAADETRVAEVQYERDAALIAASPDMLVALKALLAEARAADRLYGEQFGESLALESTWKAARAAIRKAEGGEA
jgi:hypothetical protein